MGPYPAARLKNLLGRRRAVFIADLFGIFNALPGADGFSNPMV